MQFFQYDTVKAMGDELRRQASVHRITADEAGERAGPLGRLRHRTGHALIAMGQAVAHGGQTTAHAVHVQRQVD